LKKKGESFEIIFVSNDREDAALKKYYEAMPWLAIPFDQSTKIGSFTFNCLLI
jgi:nucleoredoxin